MKLLAKHVISARGLLGMSQADLAEAAGVSADTVNRFEREKTPPLKEDSLWRIQTALEQCGIEFMNSGRPGVRYHPDRDRRRMARSEPSKPVG